MGITSTHRPSTVPTTAKAIEDNQPNVLGTYRFVQGNTATQLRFILLPQGSKTPYDLTGATVNVHVRNANTKEFLTSRECFINADEAADGIAYFVWSEQDIANASGLYEGEIEIIWSDGTKERLFDVLHLVIREKFA